MGKKDKKRKRERELERLALQKEKRRREKERLKANETPEERRARRAAKKAAKRAKEQEEKRLFGYDNSSNPFNDSNLTQPFVWKAKIKQDIALGKSVRKPSKKELRQKQIELREEIEKVKKRREEREREQAELEEMREQMRRDLDAEANLGWEEKEEQFHLQQAKLRSEIRIREGREKAVDLLSKNLAFYLYDPKREAEKKKKKIGSSAGGTEDEMDFDIELTEPHEIFDALEEDDLTELEDDIRDRLSLCETNKAMQTDDSEIVDLEGQISYWQSLLTVCEHQLALVKADYQAHKVYNLPELVQVEVEGMLQDKDLAELAELEDEIEEKIEGAVSGKYVGIDIPYWETMSKQLDVYKAKMELRDFHEALLEKRLRELEGMDDADERGVNFDYYPSDEDENGNRKERANDSDDSDFEPTLLPYEGKGEGEGEGEDEGGPAKKKRKKGGSMRAGSKSLKQADDKEDTEKKIVVGNFTPELIRDNIADVEKLTIVDPDEDFQNLQQARNALLQTRVRAERKRISNQARLAAAAPASTSGGIGTSSSTPSSDELFQREANKKIAGDEARFSVEMDLYTEQEHEWWHEKYKPRKPRYFNKVKTGFDWNKYNKTHYDKENPPPRTVSGYKFNIFYPDLIDPSIAPTYKLTKDPENPDYCTIRFSAGPPYEDIAFKIVNKEWNYMPMHGFKCVFDRGVLQLYFSFRKYFYRR